jgi:hypothetical protein
VLTNTNPPAAVTITPSSFQAAAVIVSHGKNGYGAISYRNGTANTTPTTADELANLGVGVFVSREHSALGSTAGEFDDIVTWISASNVYRVVVAADKLPR